MIDSGHRDPIKIMTLKTKFIFKLNPPFLLLFSELKHSFSSFSFLNQTNLEKDLNFCQAELEADLEKVETVNKSPSAHSPQVFPVFLLLLVLFQALPCFLLCSLVSMLWR